ncbi:hypothetical protein DIZ81_01420 [Legionella taurinensis]|uniref:Uncharacterized protein n=1 Tax=Legionella taurinensis TaxID=70611 RepID=A0A3A5LJ13_9GAMM|nr:hypothetical protein [Legionella taurinensis]MDX1836460.1 hypothetical protein [Legionella taurinensis]PUT43068.1 hypothetical protein DB744_01425 [Legionella taurinensis]PUT45114.1 hypothetical protein DB743_07125 [Legionella taurinensis]PUT45623.1 hypothetical protein DB746_01425 [Legionella taurinensis]PUT49392.1 hypothetical protein DB745_01425 [Legionella taurinensis]
MGFQYKSYSELKDNWTETKRLYCARHEATDIHHLPPARKHRQIQLEVIENVFSEIDKNEKMDATRRAKVITGFVHILREEIKEAREQSGYLSRLLKSMIGETEKGDTLEKGQTENLLDVAAADSMVLAAWQFFNSVVYESGKVGDKVRKDHAFKVDGLDVNKYHTHMVALKERYSQTVFSSAHTKTEKELQAEAEELKRAEREKHPSMLQSVRSNLSSFIWGANSKAEKTEEKNVVTTQPSNS